MTRDEVFELAREADIDWHRHWTLGEEVNRLEVFAALVAAHEREACAKVCEEVSEDLYMDSAEYREVIGCAAAIRARGNV